MSHRDSREFFSASEFGADADRMDSAFIAKLDMARAAAGVPFKITSGWRPADKSKAHALGKAVDIRARDSVTRFAIVHALVSAGFRRIGLYYKTGHVHVDANTAAEGYPQDVLWVSKGRK